MLRLVRYMKVEDKYEIYKLGDPLMMNLLEIEMLKSKYPETIVENPTITFEDDVYVELPEFDTIQSKNEIEKNLEKIEKESIEIAPTTPEKEPENEITKSPEIETEEPKTENEILTDIKNKREDVVMSNVEMKTQKFTVLIRDYGTEDNDTVTVFFNNKIIRKNLRITNQAEVIELEINPELEVNKLVFVANNLGDVPPNTARVFIIDENGNRQVHELFSDERNNAVIELRAVKED